MNMAWPKIKKTQTINTHFRTYTNYTHLYTIHDMNPNTKPLKLFNTEKNFKTPNQNSHESCDVCFSFHDEQFFGWIVWIILLFPKDAWLFFISHLFASWNISASTPFHPMIILPDDTDTPPVPGAFCSTKKNKKHIGIWLGKPDLQSLYDHRTKANSAWVTVTPLEFPGHRWKWENRWLKVAKMYVQARIDISVYHGLGWWSWIFLRP